MGLSPNALRFLNDLAANNSRDWFEENRESYENDIKAPALDLIASVSGEMSSMSPALRAEPRLNGSFRRLNRDTRFSKDKTPYSPRVHLVFWHGDHPNRSPGMHFVLHGDGVGFGAGQWAIEPDRLKALREKISDPRQVDQLLSALDQAREIGCRLGKPDLARVPRGFDAENDHAELLKYKGFVARTHDEMAPPENLIGDAAHDWIVSTTRRLLPLLQWLTN